MDRQTLITNLYVDPDIAKAIGKMNPAELRDDLRQEMFLALCEQSEEKLMRMYEEGWIKFFLVRTKATAQPSISYLELILASLWIGIVKILPKCLKRRKTL
jgi:hypothetical protein